MIKNYLYSGLGFFIVGIFLLSFTYSLDSNFESMIFGFGFAFFFTGIVQIIKYFYWNSSSTKREAYKKKIENEKIERHDEFKEKIRGMTIRFTFIAELLIVTCSIVIFDILGKVGYIANSRIIVLYLGGLLLIQLVISYIIYFYLLRKYTT